MRGVDASPDAYTPASDVSLDKTDPELAAFTSDQILEPMVTRSPIFSQPTPSLYRRAQLIFEGLDYCTCHLCSH
jgi:hypothetical protein